MLNYLWAGLIIASLGFALYHDVSDLATDRYANGRPLPVTVVETDEATTLRIEPADYAALYDTTPAEPLVLPATIDEDGLVTLSGDLPEPLATMAGHADPEEGALTATLEAGALVFEPTRFVKMAAIQAAAFGMAETGAEIAIGLIGLLALWLGLMKIGEAAGLIDILVKLVRPLLGWLFPQVPRDHPALGLIALNLTANVLGLGNAATPLGLKAMQSLQELNPTDDTATDPMVMLLALNTASVQLVPPVTLVAIMGLEAGRLTIPIIVVTALSLIVAITAAKLIGRMRMYRRTDPMAVAKEVA